MKYVYGALAALLIIMLGLSCVITLPKDISIQVDPNLPDRIEIPYEAE